MSVPLFVSPGDSEGDSKLIGSGMDQPPELESILHAWRLWQEAQRLSERTITERAMMIRRLVQHSGDDALTLTPEGIILFCGRRELKPNAAATYHATIRAYCKWLVRTKRRGDDPTDETPRPKRVRTTARPVEDSDLAGLLGVVGRKRTRMMVLLACLAGLREHEIAKFHGGDLDRRNGIITVTGKGGSTEMIPADPEIIAEAEAMGFPEDGYWFPSYEAHATGRPHVTRSAVYAALSAAMRRARITGTPHALRHWYATTLLDKGADLRTVQQMLRHKSITSTQIYTLVRMRQMKEAQARVSLPRAA